MADVLETALAYLHDHHVMSLATHGRSGVWSAALFYVAERFEITFLSDSRSRHAQNIDYNPHVAATVQENYLEWTEIKGIQLEGSVRRLEGVERDRAVAAYIDRFPFVNDVPGAIRQALARISWYRIVPDRLYFIDNSRGFGHRDRII